MLQTIEAEIDVNGTVHQQAMPRSQQRKWLDVIGAAPYPLAGEDAQDWVTRTRNEGNYGEAQSVDDGNVSDVLRVLRNPEFISRKSYSAEDIDAQIQENRNSWER